MSIRLLQPQDADQLLELEDQVWHDLEKKGMGDYIRKYTIQEMNETLNESRRLFALGLFFKGHLKSTMQFNMDASVFKKDYNAAFDASYFPKGLLIVHSSSGWSAKVFIP